ncbi:unnamed protein product [Lepeophtheirus salmonis]|uniref:(salmon louse) hypothetical protein n=1 Tax=Lepeophtheirus salmonis TaxID=72036 RepID=A0A7R8H1C7_LEPSM|nr:unnamed protein product [Lepeophtheirus salmonis]CAF2804964.1 unnamed protein product [Lepeophtheirus salmonis]
MKWRVTKERSPSIVLHISICFYTLWTGRGGRENKLIKLYSGLFNDGPQFILKIIFITYYGFDEKGNTIISLSTMTSFIGLIRTNRELAKQDSIRSICYGLASILIPVGFNNDEMYFQQPNTGIADINLVNPQEMRSSYFLLLYGTSNIFIFFGLAYYTFSRTILEYPISTLMILTQICVGQCYLGLYLHASLSILMRKRETSITTVTDSSIIYWTRPFQ